MGPGGKWDYKHGKGNSQYENFGNYNYGVTGTAAGFSEITLKSAAGIAQWFTNPDGSEGGFPYWESPYWDQEKDQKWIKEGVKDYEMEYDNHEHDTSGLCM